MNNKIRFSRQQQQENISRKQIGEFLELNSFITSDLTPDLGEDILVRIFDKGVSTGLSFYLQLKSTNDIKKCTLNSGMISYPFEIKDINHWAAQAITVFLVVWDINLKKGWWIWIKDANKQLSNSDSKHKNKKQFNIRFPSTNILNENGLIEIRHILADLYYAIISQDKEFSINAKFVFSQDEEGKEKLQEFLQHRKTGDEICFTGKYIDEFVVPEWWERLYGHFSTTDLTLVISPQRSINPIPSQLIFKSMTKEERIPYVEFWIVKRGTVEITLSNDQQKSPYKISLIINSQNNTIRFNIDIDFPNVNFEEIHQLLRIQDVLSLGGRIQIMYLNTNETINIPVPIGKFEPIGQDVLCFIDKLCTIQKKMGIVIQPQIEGRFSKNDEIIADEIFSIITNGYFQKDGLEFSLDLKKAGVKYLLKKIEEGKQVELLISSNESYVEILSQKIDLGPMIQRVKGYLLNSSEEIIEWFSHADKNDSIEIKIKDVSLYEEFENWKK